MKCVCIHIMYTVFHECIYRAFWEPVLAVPPWKWDKASTLLRKYVVFQRNVFYCSRTVKHTHVCAHTHTHTHTHTRTYTCTHKYTHTHTHVYTHTHTHTASVTHFNVTHIQKDHIVYDKRVYEFHGLVTRVSLQKPDPMCNATQLM